MSSVRVLVGIDDPAITGEDGRGGNTVLGTKASAATVQPERGWNKGEGGGGRCAGGCVTMLHL